MCSTCAAQSAIHRRRRRSTSLSVRATADAAHTMSLKVTPAARAFAASIFLPFHFRAPPKSFATRLNESSQGLRAFNSSYVRPIMASPKYRNRDNHDDDRENERETSRTSERGIVGFHLDNPRFALTASDASASDW